MVDAWLAGSAVVRQIWPAIPYVDSRM